MSVRLDGGYDKLQTGLKINDVVEDYLPATSARVDRNLIMDIIITSKVVVHSGNPGRDNVEMAGWPK